MYTRCPDCRTAFRITAEQLAQAHGQVRCGVCSACFSALESLSEQIISSPAQARPDTVAPAPAEQVAHHEQAASTLAAQTEKVTEETTAPSPALIPDATPAAEQLVEHHAAASALKGAESNQQKTSATSSIKPTPIDATKQQSVTQPPKPQDVEEQLPSADAAAPPVPKTSQKIAARPDALPDLGIIAAEPRPMTEQVGAPSGFKTAVWATVNIILIATLLGQYAYFNRDELVKYPELRPWLAQLCAVTGCDTPLLRDVSRINLINRIVGSHPRHPNALLIDVTLVNEADFPQPYPLLEIRFSDLNNQLVAGRRFRPSEYLSAGTALSAGMAPRQPLNIILEIADPGKDAVSFQFELI